MTIEAWYMDDSDADQRLPHKREPNLPVSSEALIELGVLQWSLSGSEDDEDLAKIRSDRGYSYKDVVDIHKDRMPGYEAKLKTFFEEHIHTDEEIRYVLDGSGYFDVRDKEDQWIRVSMSKGDMIVLPAGIYHRFTLDSNNYIKACRLFVGVPVWTPHNRCEATDAMPERASYVVDLEAGAVGATPGTADAAEASASASSSSLDEAASAAVKRAAGADAAESKKPKAAVPVAAEA